MLRFLSIKSFRMKLLLIIWIGSTATLFLASGCFIFFEITQFDKDLIKEMKVISTFIADKGAQAIMLNDSAIANDALLSAGAANDSVVHASVYDAEGMAIANYNDDVGDRGMVVAIEPHLQETHFSDGRLHSFNPIEMYSDRLGTVYIQADRHVLYGRLQNYAVVVAVIMAISLVFLVFISMILQRLVSKPLLALIASTKQVSERRDYSIRVQADGKDELGVLANAFNEMLAQTELRDSALRTSEEHYRILVEGTESFVTRVDTDGVLLYVNKAAERVYGLNAAECIGLSAFEFVHPDDQTHTREAFEEWLRMKTQRVTIENRQVSRTGEVRDMSWTCKLVLDEEGGISWIDGIAQDITERKCTEEALRLSEERFSKAFHASPDTISITRVADGMIMDVNDATEEMFETTRATAIGKTTAELEFWTDPSDRERILTEYRAGHSIRNMETRYRRPSGEQFEALYSGEIIEAGGEACIISVVRDITERNQAERALRLSEERFSKAFHASPDTISITRLSDGLIIDVNHTFESMLGLTRAEAIGRTNTILGLWVDGSVRNEIMAHLQAGEAVRHRECKYRRASGELFDALYSGETLEIGAETCVLSIVRDITEQKRTEAAIKSQMETQKLLLSELDHRVRNNLSALLSLIEISRTGAKSTDELANAIHGRTQAIASVHAILSDAQWKCSDLKKLLNTIIQPARSTRVQTEGPPVLIPTSQAQALGLVINELATNSAKYGAMSVDGAEIEITWTTQSSEEGETSLILRWSEINGPAIETEPSSGNGLALVSGLIRSELRGRAELSFPPNGALHSLQITLTTDATAQFSDPIVHESA